MSIYGFRQPTLSYTASVKLPSRIAPHFGTQSTTPVETQQQSTEDQVLSSKFEKKKIQTMPDMAIDDESATPKSDEQLLKVPSEDTTEGSNMAPAKATKMAEKITSDTPNGKTDTPASKPEVSIFNTKFLESSFKLFKADKELIEKFAAFEDRLPFLPQKGYVQSLKDYFKPAALRRPGEVEQAGHHIMVHYKLIQATLTKMRQLSQDPLRLAQLKRNEPGKLEDLVHVMHESTTAIQKEIGKIQTYDRQNQTFFRMPFWSLSRTNRRVVHQLDRALEKYKEASDSLLNT